MSHFQCPECYRHEASMVVGKGEICRRCARRWVAPTIARSSDFSILPEHLHSRWTVSLSHTAELDAVPGWIRLPSMGPHQPRRVISSTYVTRFETGCHDNWGPVGVRDVVDVAAAATWLGVWLLAVIASDGTVNVAPFDLPFGSRAPTPTSTRSPPRHWLRAVLADRSTVVLADDLLDSREAIQITHGLDDLRRSRPWHQAPASWEPSRKLSFVGTAPIPTVGAFATERYHLTARWGHFGKHTLYAHPDGLSLTTWPRAPVTVSVDDVVALETRNIARASGQSSFELLLSMRRGELLLMRNEPSADRPRYVEQELRRLWRLPSE